jgi:hypothetical protein
MYYFQYYLTMVSSLLFLAWLGNMVNNMLLTYLAGKYNLIYESLFRIRCVCMCLIAYIHQYQELKSYVLIE